MVWLKPSVQGACPSGRGGCASAVVGDMCLFIGGADRSPRAFDDVWVLKLTATTEGWVGGGQPTHPDHAIAGRWVKKTTTVRGGSRLPERTGATATAVGRKVYVFGGQEPTRGVAFNDVVVLDCTTWEWSRLEVSGPSPPPRHSHVACSALGGRLLVVYGGAGGDGEGPLGDVHVLDLREGAERWTRPRVTGQAPEPREMAAACMLPTSSWEDLSRGGGGGGGDDDDVETSSDGDREMLVVGGRGRGGVLCGAMVLDTREMSWTRRGSLTSGPLCAHTVVPWIVGGSTAAKPAALVFGGFTGAALCPPEPLTVEGSTLTTLTHPAERAKGASEETFVPAPRFAHAAVPLPANVLRGLRGARAGMLVFAGVSPAFDLDDLAVWVDVDPAAAVSPDSGPGGPAAVPAADLD